MIFLGDFLCGSVMSVPCTPTNIDNITRIELSNGWYDDLRVTKNVTEELSSKVEQDWDWDTILHAKFDGDVSAGNVNWNLSKVSHLLVKRKKTKDFKWTTINAQECHTRDDFNLKDIDITAAPNYEYQYAAVPIIEGIEGFYSIDTVDVKTNSLVLADKDEIWCTLITDNYLDNTSVVPNSLVETMYSKYPTVVRNTSANYEKIDVSASFFPEDETGCNIDLDDDQKRIEYNKKVKMFLRNDKPKILKSISGDIWLTYVYNPPADTAQDNYKNRKLTFGLVEVGNPDSEEDLWYAGFIPTVTEEWWNR